MITASNVRFFFEITNHTFRLRMDSIVLILNSYYVYGGFAICAHTNYQS